MVKSVVAQTYRSPKFCPPAARNVVGIPQLSAAVQRIAVAFIPVRRECPQRVHKTGQADDTEPDNRTRRGRKAKAPAHRASISALSRRIRFSSSGVTSRA